MKTPGYLWRKYHFFLISKAVINAFMFGLLIAVIWSAAKTKNEGRKAAIILYKIKNEVDDKEVIEKVRDLGVNYEYEGHMLDSSQDTTSALL